MSNDYVDIPNELNFMFNNFGNIQLVKKTRLSVGRNNLTDIKWHTYEIKKCEIPDFEYDCIHLMYSEITKDTLNVAQNRIANKGVSTEERPNIDGNTGNVHPDKAIETNGGEKRIKQLVLCRERGPITPCFIETEDYYCYNAVHKACYYPLIHDEKNLHKDYRYLLLKRVWNLLGKSVVETEELYSG